MKVLIGLCVLTVLVPNCQAFTYFQHTNELSMRWLEGQRIEYFSDNHLIGFVSYAKVPLLPIVIIHSLYILPDYRNQGHGSQLVTYVCNHSASQGAKRIYIQPGPFEIGPNGCLRTSAQPKELLVSKLVRFYKKHQFVEVSKAVSFLAMLIYAFLGIEEDATYLMVHSIAD